MPEYLEERGHGSRVGVSLRLLGSAVTVLDRGAVEKRVPLVPRPGGFRIGHLAFRIVADFERHVRVRAEEERSERRVICRDVDVLRHQTGSPRPVDIFEIVGSEERERMAERDDLGGTHLDALLTQGIAERDQYARRIVTRADQASTTSS